MKTGPFIDGRNMNARHVPGTVQIPTATTIATKAVPGVFVKLGCRDDFFWIQVNTNDPGKQIITGMVISSPQASNRHDIRMRDHVRFGYKNVLDILVSGG